MKYSNIISDFTWSYSRINQFEMCPYAFLLHYIKHTPKKPLFFSDYGSFIHKLIEQYLNEELSKEELPAEYLSRFKREVLGAAPNRDIFKSYFNQGYEYLSGINFPYTNLGKVMLGEYDYAPCTPTGILNILDEAGYGLSGKSCVIIGRSNIVGKPLAAMLTQRDMTVTLCHSKTKNLAEITKQADVVVCAVGKANFLTADMVSSDAIVIDVGINRTDDGKLVGDICAEEVSAKARAITPVPGGVGVMTVTALLENTYKAALLSTTERSEAREE